jgi:hypothetical protein
MVIVVLALLSEDAVNPRHDHHHHQDTYDAKQAIAMQRKKRIEFIESKVYIFAIGWRGGGRPSLCDEAGLLVHQANDESTSSTLLLGPRLVHSSRRTRISA